MAKQIGPNNVIGRDKIIKHLWRTLESESVVFTAERRIGKTTVLKKMQAEPVDGKVVIYADLEKINTAKQFVENILNSLSAHLTKSQAAHNWFETLLPKLGGTAISGVITLPKIEGRNWQSLLEKTINGVCKNQSEQQFVFLWDEIPYMLQNIHQTDLKAGKTQSNALQILDTLRALRNEHPNLRMIYTGSIGLHHVLSQLRDDKLASQPTNDMAPVEIGPLAAVHAKTLAKKLLSEDDIECDDEAAVIAALIRLTDAVPFYMHRVVTALSLIEGEIDVAQVESQVKKHLVISNDPWQMEHFRQRLPIYYPGDIQDSNNQPLPNASVAKHLLNHLALTDDSQTINQCFNAIKAQVNITQRDMAVELLGLLAKDHYIEKDDDGKYQFCFALLKRWWILAEGLNDE